MKRYDYMWRLWYWKDADRANRDYRFSRLGQYTRYQFGKTVIFAETLCQMEVK